MTRDRSNSSFMGENAYLVRVTFGALRGSLALLQELPERSRALVLPDYIFEDVSPDKHEVICRIDSLEELLEAGRRADAGQPL